MQKTSTRSLYDLLELNIQASDEAIQAAYDRLNQAYLKGTLKSGALDPDTYFNLIRDAYSTLSSPERRRRYDERLLSLQGAAKSDPVVIYAEPEQTLWGLRPMLWVLILILGCGVGFYLYSSHKVEQEKQRRADEVLRLVREQADAERQRQEEAAELARVREEKREQAQREQEARRAQAEHIRLSNQIDRDLASAQRQQQYEQERQKRALEQQMRRNDTTVSNDAYRRAEQERQFARQREYENRNAAPRAGGIQDPRQAASSSYPAYYR